MWCDLVSSGTAGKWVLGVVIVTHLIAYNETGGVGAIFSMVIAGVNSIFIVMIKTATKNIQMGYLRAAHKFDFFVLYLAITMDILSLLVATAVLARTISTCLDAMTGGLARIYILGRNSPENEPWPDVLGVGVVFVVTGMFMLGLENTKMFTILMFGSVIGITCILSAMVWFKGEQKYWKAEKDIACHLRWIMSGSSLCTFAFPSDIPYIGKYPIFANLGLICAVLASNMFTCGLLSTLVQYNSNHEYEAVPMLTVLEEKSFHKTLPVVACLLVLSSSGAILDIFPEMYNLIVKLTKPDFKVLSKQIGHETFESGSPVLAVFIGGSLVAMVSFACPLEDMMYIMGGSYLIAAFLRSFYLLYQPFRPKYLVQEGSATLSYSRLDTTRNSHKSDKHLLWFLKRKASQAYHAIPKSDRNEHIEREWLLLGEPTSPVPKQESPTDIESTILSDPSTEDIECIDKEPNDHQSESESATDIDAIVDEYRQKVKVSTAGVNDVIKLPSSGSWIVAVFLVFIIVCGAIFTTYGILNDQYSFTYVSLAMIFVSVITLHILPKYQTSSLHPSILTCSIGIVSFGIFLGIIVSECWAPLLIWITASLLIFVRCDRYCCICLNQDTPDASMNEILISKGCSATVHLTGTHQQNILMDRNYISR